METSIFQNITGQLQNFWLMVAIVNGIIHVIFASAVARDAGNLVKTGRQTWFVSGITWAFATLIGGMLVVAVYWVMHWSSFSRSK